jgi:O-antigen ligase
MMQPTALPTRIDLASPFMIAVLGALVSLGTAWALVFQPPLAMAGPATLAALLLVADARVRFVFVIGGGLIFLQGSSELTLPKLAYLGVVALALGVAILRIIRLEQTPGFKISRPLLVSSAVLFFMIALSFPVAMAYGHSMKDWVRDVAPYALFATAPIFAVDVHQAFSPRALRLILVVAGSVATISYVVEWTARRDLIDLPVSRIALPSFLLAAVLVAFGMAMALTGRGGTLRWLVLTTVVVAMLPLTGSRSVVIILVAPLAIAIAARRGRWRRSLRLAVFVPVMAILAGLALQFVIQASGADPDAFSKRIVALTEAGESHDQSYQERVAQFEVSWEAFLSAPATGIGPGATFDWQRSGDPWLTLDTPLSFLAKFGLIGVAAVLLLALGYLRFLRNLRRAVGISIPYLALLGYLAVLAGWAVLYVPFEDKGSGMALSILVAVAISEAQKAARTASNEAAA